MDYDKKKWLTALLSMISVMVAMVAVIFVKEGIGELRIITMTTLAATVAAMSAFISIYMSKRLDKEREKKKIVIIYAREDLEQAHQLYGELKKKGFNPWLDVEEILPGDIWAKTVHKAIEESVAALVLVSENFDKKEGFVKEELKAALATMKEHEKGSSPIIPIKISNADIPKELSHIQWVDLNEPNGHERLELGLQRLMS